MRSTKRSTVVLGQLVLLPCPGAFAADLHVPADFATIQEAMDAADPGDRVLVADGVYSGPGNIDLDPGGKVLVISSVNGPADCILEGSSTPGAHAFVLSSGEHAGTVIDGFTITGFHTVAGDEGAIRLTGASPAISNCVFAANRTADEGEPTPPGSAIAVIAGTPTTQGNRFTGNQGSALYIDDQSVIYVIDSVFEDNLVRTTDGRGGAAILNEGFMLTFDSFFLKNRVEALSGAARGGAIAHLGGMLDLTTATFEGNVVTGAAETGGSAVFITSQFVMNQNTVASHDGSHDGGAVLIEPAEGTGGAHAFMSGDFQQNGIGAVRIHDPRGRLEVRILGSDFCSNDHFDIEGPFVDWGGNGVCCPGDMDDSGTVALADLLTLLSSWGPCRDCPADLDGDGAVAFSDLLALLGGWGPCPSLPAG